MSEPRAYVGCLAAYNSGKLHGAWVNLGQPLDDIFDEVRDKVLKTSPCANSEKWLVLDVESMGDMKRYTLNESCLEMLQLYAALYSKYGELGAAMLDYCAGDVESAEQYLEDCYLGEFDCEREFVYQLIDDNGWDDVPPFFKSYIDYEMLENDLFNHGSYFSLWANGSCHIFERS